MKTECLFCKIINKEVSAKVVYRGSEVIVIEDIRPKKRVHLLLLPTVHINSFLDLRSNQYLLLTKMVKVVQTLIRSEKIEKGYEIIFNGGSYQHVPHLHWHVLGD